MPDDTFFRQILDHVSEVIWMLDTECEQLRYVNPAYKDTVGIDTQEELHPTRVVHPNDRNRASQWLADIRSDIANGTPAAEYPLEIQLTDATGTQRYFETVAVPVYEGDSVVGVAGISADVTDRVEREQQLQDQVERLDQFASMVSHDLRGPLTKALSRLELYESDGDAVHLESTRDALKRIDEITADLLRIAKGGGVAVDPEPVDLAEIAREAWDHTDTRSATLDAESVTVEGDSGALRTMLENLFRNSVGHGGHDVTVRLGPLPDGFFVEDTGKGIQTDIQSSVFDHGTTTGYAGSGIGLTIVQRVAEGHGWNVTATESANGGARFEFRRSD